MPAETGYLKTAGVHPRDTGHPARQLYVADNKNYAVILAKILMNISLSARSNCMEIIKVMGDKDKYMDILLLGDEQESMVKKYLYRGELFALYDDDLKTVSVITKESEEIYEIKNIATYDKYQGNGYGSIMVKYIIDNIKNKGKQLLVGTGESDKIIAFYKKFGFKYSHTIKDFFIDNYNHEMYEDGKQLKDMIYLKIEF